MHLHTYTSCNATDMKNNFNNYLLGLSGGIENILMVNLFKNLFKNDNGDNFQELTITFIGRYLEYTLSLHLESPRWYDATDV